MPELDLPRGPRELFHAVHKPLARAFGGEDNIRFGGGTALAARWAHRHSVDVDLFVEREPYRHFHWNTGGRFTLDLTAQAPVERINIGRETAAIADSDGFLASRFPPEGFGPRFFASSRSDPPRAAFRHPDRCELYSPSRRSSRPTSPGVSQASARSTIANLYSAVKRRLVAFADTSGSGAAAALRLLSPGERSVPFDFIPSPGAIS